MSSDVVSCRLSDVLYDIWLVMKPRGLQRVLIITPCGAPIGVIYGRDALQYLLGEVEFEGELMRDYIGGVGYR